MDPTLQSVDELMAALYPLARRMAARQLGAGSGADLQRTELVANAYIRIKQSDPSAALSQAHFLSLLARVLRQVVVDHWRQGERRQGTATPLVQTLSQLTGGSASLTSMLRLDELLDRLEQTDAMAAEVVSLRVFGGMTAEEIAEQLNVGTATVGRKWRMGSAWLRQELQ